MSDILDGIRRRFPAIGYLRLLGAELALLDHGQVHLALARRPELLQQHGFFHGGAIASLVDAATTMAASTVLRPGQASLTAEYKLNLLSPARGARLVCRASVVKPGRLLNVVSADCFSIAEDGAETRCAIALATIAVLAADSLPPLLQPAPA
jgi:uncharacterized protein (TIGR00369 family)